MRNIWRKFMEGKNILTTSLISAFALIIGGIIGNYIGYKGAEKNANAQITAAWEGAQGQIRSAQEAAEAQITSAWIPARATETAEVRLTKVALSATPNPESTKTSINSPTLPYSDAIIVMTNFYNWINNAGNSDDLIKSWNLETTGENGFQQREWAAGKLSNFQYFWWQWKVQYKLFDCGSNVVIAEIVYYSRNTKITPTPSESTKIFKFQLVVDDDRQLKIDSSTSIEGPGVECILSISNP
jgi:hypothetical protein